MPSSKIRGSAELEAPRSEVRLRHPLFSVVTTWVMAVLAGADGPAAIPRTAKLKAEFLERVPPWPYGIPSQDLFGRVLAALDQQAFQAGFGARLAALRALAEGTSDLQRPTFQIDGKTLRRPHDRQHGLGALRSVSLWAADYGVSLGEAACT